MASSVSENCFVVLRRMKHLHEIAMGGSLAAAERGGFMSALDQVAKFRGFQRIPEGANLSVHSQAYLNQSGSSAKRTATRDLAI
jgi:hypothetical protein